MYLVLVMCFPRLLTSLSLANTADYASRECAVNTSMRACPGRLTIAIWEFQKGVRLKRSRLEYFPIRLRAPKSDSSITALGKGKMQLSPVFFGSPPANQIATSDPTSDFHYYSTPELPKAPGLPQSFQNPGLLPFPAIPFPALRFNIVRSFNCPIVQFRLQPSASRRAPFLPHRPIVQSPRTEFLPMRSGMHHGSVESTLYR